MDIIGGITVAGQALGVLRGLRSIEKDFDQVTLKLEIINLIDMVVDIKGALQDARLQVDELNAEIVQLRRDAQVREDTIEYSGMRYRPSVKREGQAQGTPFCPRCDTVDGRMILTVDNKKGPGVVCPQCKSEFVRVKHFLWDNEL